MSKLNSKHYDTIVIGSGPGGEGAAMKLSKSGQRVAVIERYERVGGGSTHWGTIPSKTLRHNIQLLVDYRRNPLFQHTAEHFNADYPQLLQTADTVIRDQVNTLTRYYARNRVDLYNGHARFVDPNKILVEHSDISSLELEADHFVIATGSRPYHPADVDFSHPRILDSDSVLALEHTPKSLIIYGAGVIGCEYASIFCNLDVKVNLVNTRDRLLVFLDDEITDALGYHLRNQGVVIRHNEVYEKIVPMDDGVVLHCKSGKQFKSELLLWANARSGNTNNLGLDAIGVGINQRGQVVVDRTHCTEQKHIFAVGDVSGPPGLSSASYDQGRFVGAHIADGDCDWSLLEEYPTGIYTNPEISSIGRTERELTDKQVPFEVGQAMFQNIARARITGHTVGMLKILFHRETLEILGIHCFGETAAEIIHIGQAIMSRTGSGNNLRYFTETTFNYPTMAEAYRVAALNGLNRLF